MLSAIDASRISVLQYPALRAAFTCIKKMAFAKYFEEDLLHDILCFARIPHYPQGNAEHRPILATEKCVHRVVMASLEVRNQILITQATESASSNGGIMLRTRNQR